MKTKKLLQAIGDIRPDYIEAALKHGVTEAESAEEFLPETEPAPQHRTVLHRIVTAASLAACTALVIGCGVWIHHAGRAARENSRVTNSAAEHTVEIEPATAAPGQPADESNSVAAGTETKAAPNESDAALTDPGAQSGKTDTQTLLMTDTTAKPDSSSAQKTENSSGTAQSAPEKPETTKSRTSEPQKNSIDVRVIKSYSYSDKLVHGQPAAYVMHSAEDIWFGFPDNGSPLGAIQAVFHAEDSLRDWRTEEFFRGNDLILSGLMLGTGSCELGLGRLTVTESGAGDPPKVLLSQLLYEPEVGDCAECGYYMAIRVPKGMIEGYPETVADVQYIKPEYDPVTGRMTDDRLNFWRESCKEELCFAIED